VSKRKAECTPEEWALYREKERRRKASPANKARMREYEKRPEVIAMRKAYERKRDTTPERRAYNKALRDRPESRAKRLAYIKTYNADPRVKAYRKAYNLRVLYGIDVEDMVRLVLLQQGKCAVCNRPFSDETKGMKPHVDHNHETGKVRGLLCGPCNTVEGFIFRLGLTPTGFAKRLEHYLAHPPSQEEVLW